MTEGAGMTARRYELTDFEWSIIEPLLPNKPRGVPRVDDRKVLNWHLLALADGLALGRHPGALRAADDLLQSLCAVAQARRLGSHFRGSLSGLRRRPADRRLVLDPRAPACGKPQKRGLEGPAAGDAPHARCMGRSRGGLTTKIHALVDANGLPIALKLSEGQAHDGHSAADMLSGSGPARSYSPTEPTTAMLSETPLLNGKPG